MEVKMKGKISSKGQVTVPKEVRDALGLKAGDFVAFVAHDGEALLSPVKPPSLDDLRGALADYGKGGPIPKQVYRKKIGKALGELDRRTRGH
jgi:AbrB family looped-hinge helix DNA binding protein